MEFARLAKEFPIVKASSRTRICSGEEATVFRINNTNNPFFRSLMERGGLVERRLELRASPGSAQNTHRKIVKDEPTSVPDGFYSDTMRAQVLNFYFMRLANVLLPQNFPKVHALRFYKGKGEKMEARLYTEFVPDGNGAIARKVSALERFRKLRDVGEEYGSLRAKTDAEERMNCKGLEEAVNKVHAAGFVMNHPEMNYHEREGIPVFFEVDEIVLKKLAGYVYEMPEGSQKTRAKAAFAMLFAALVATQNILCGTRLDFEQRARGHHYANWNFYSLYFYDNPAFFARYLVDACLGKLDSGTGAEQRPPSIIRHLAVQNYNVWRFMKNELYFEMFAPGSYRQQKFHPEVEMNAPGSSGQQESSLGAVDAKTGFWEGALNAAKRMLERSLQTVRQQI